MKATLKVNGWDTTQILHLSLMGIRDAPIHICFFTSDPITILKWR